MNMRIAEVLRMLGISPKYKGFFIISTALTLLYNEPWKLYRLNQFVYPVMIQQFSMSQSTIERNIRFTIQKAWNDKRNISLRRLFSTCELDEEWPPGVCEFLAILLIEIRRTGTSQIEAK